MTPMNQDVSMRLQALGFLNLEHDRRGVLNWWQDCRFPRQDEDHRLTASMYLLTLRANRAEGYLH